MASGTNRPSVTISIAHWRRMSSGAGARRHSSTVGRDTMTKMHFLFTCTLSREWHCACSHEGTGE